MTRHFADLIAMKTCMCLGLATGIMAVIGARSGLAERGRLMSGGSPLQASATPKATSVLPDLRFHTFVGGWPGWRYDRSCFNEPYFLTIEVENGGGSAAGPFVIQDGQVAWVVAGLEPGVVWYTRGWGGYPDFPLIIDPYDQGVESAEDNNVIALPVGTPWTATPRFAERRATPPAPAASLAGLQPLRLMTQPRPCPTRTPVPSLTPAGRPELPDLIVADAVWDAQAIVLRGQTCRPTGQSYRLSVTIKNQGKANSGTFVVGTSGDGWMESGLRAGESRTLSTEPRFLPASIMVDSGDDVEESREDNNGWLPPANGTPTPAVTPPPFCQPTPSPTPVPLDRLPDLRLAWLRWGTAALGRPPCLGPLWRLTLAVRNDGLTAAGPFVVDAGDFRWSFAGIPAKSEAVGQGGPLNVVTWPILIDALDQVRERDETNNRVERNLTLTATPTGTPPITCSPTPPPVTVTVTPRPPVTVTVTPRPQVTDTATTAPIQATPSRTASPTATLAALALPLLGRR